MTFRHPGKLFVRQFGPVECAQDVQQYIEFLRSEIGLRLSEPVELQTIYAHFGIPEPQLAPLPGQGGMLLGQIGQIIINQSDIAARQRFSEAHELVEFLFDALPSGKGWAKYQKGPFKHRTKENLCNLGAAELLMPAELFAHYANSEGISFGSARKLSRQFRVSITAALVQLVRVGPGRAAVVNWRQKHKKSDRKQRVPAAQLPLLAEMAPAAPRKKLRVEWAMSGPRGPFIPKNKSIPEESAVFACWEQARFTTGEEWLDLGPAAGHFRTENMPFLQNGEKQVLSMIEQHE